MFDEQRRQWAARRVKPGDGRPLQPFRWWQLPGRALFYLRLDDSVYAVDVRHWQNQASGDTKADLYLDGRHHARSKLPASFPVAGGTIEVAMSMFGLKRCHFVSTGGDVRQLTPDPASAEGRRARLEREHPGLSRLIGLGSVVLLLTGVVLLGSQLLGVLSRIPPVADRFGTFESPIHLPAWLNIALGAGAALASVERALRLRYGLLDRLGN